MRDTDVLKKRLDGDPEAATAQIGLARTQLGILKNQMALGGITSGVRTVTTADGTTIRASSINGLNSVQITTPREMPAGAPVHPRPAHAEPVLPPPPVVAPIGVLASIGWPIGTSQIGGGNGGGALPIQSVLNGEAAGGLGVDGDVQKVVGVEGSVTYTATLTSTLNVSVYPSPVASLQFFDMAAVRAGPQGSTVGLTALTEYYTFDGSTFGQWGSNSLYLPALFRNVLPPPDAPYRIVPQSGADPVTWVQPLRILHWQQTGGNMPLYPFTLAGETHPTVLASIVPIVITKGADYWTPTQYNTGWIVASYDASTGLFVFVNYSKLQEVVNWYSGQFEAVGIATVLGVDGVISTIPVTVNANWDLTGNTNGVPDGTVIKQNQLVQTVTSDGVGLPPAINAPPFGQN